MTAAPQPRTPADQPPTASPSTASTSIANAPASTPAANAPDAANATTAAPAPAAATTPTTPTTPTAPTGRAEQLLGVVLAMLTPLLTIGSAEDARLAAHQAIAAYHTGGHCNLVTISQIVGFAIASLDNLRLSAPPDLSLSMKLKLRGNANALSRTSLQVSAASANPPPPTADPPTADPPVQAPPPAPEPDRDHAGHHATAIAELRKVRDQLRQAQAAEPTCPSAEPLTQRQRDLAWANAMTEVAAEYSTGLAELSAAQQRIELTRINALTRTAGALTRGGPSLKTRLLSATSLQSPPPFGPSRPAASEASQPAPSHHNPSPRGASPRSPSRLDPSPQSPSLKKPPPPDPSQQRP
ncbi:hypothetical protein [Rhodopila sp.]|uniref:hypothetical protein n=1 Tax=Rhodopila sp. TaxID=2480087 RepID=UPI003D12C512